MNAPRAGAPLAARSRDAEALVIGGGFFGCCLALFLRSVTPSVVLAEAEGDIMTRASRVNQARVHTGFHYPRSALTAVRSMQLHRRFARDFPDAIDDRFEMLYAVASRMSKVSARRFGRMFADMGAPIGPARPTQAALFDHTMVDGVFACAEHAFDHAALNRHLRGRLDAAGVDLRLGAAAIAVEEGPDAARVTLSDGAEIAARHVFNVTYSHLNDVRRAAGLPPAPFRRELAEIALIEPPDALRAVGVTVMDGPFFSVMPYPAEGLHSLTHVRYTPHASWSDDDDGAGAAPGAAPPPRESRVRFMLQDAARYVPALAQARWRRSLFEVKAVLRRNEKDDGRPILYRRDEGSRMVSIIGAKIDNVYDLFEIVRRAGPAWAGASDVLVHGRRSAP